MMYIPSYVEQYECKHGLESNLVFMMQHQKVRQFDYGNELLIGTQDLG